MRGASFLIWNHLLSGLVACVICPTLPELLAISSLSNLLLRVARGLKKLITSWAKQDYFVSRRFPCLLGTIIGEIDDPKIRHIMVRNLWEEHGEGRQKATHHALFCQLMADIGIDSNFSRLTMAKSTQRFIQIQESLAREHVLLGLGSSCYANEYITIDEFAPLEKAVEYEFPGADLSFFLANRKVDARHAAESEEVIAALISSDTDLLLVGTGSRSSA